MPVRSFTMEGDVAPPEKKEVDAVLMHKIWDIATDDTENMDGLFLNCQSLVAKNMKQSDHIKTLLGTVKQVTDVVWKAEQLSLKFKSFLDTKGFLFTTPLTDLKIHPQIKTFVPNGYSSPAKKGQLTADGLEVVTEVQTKSDLPPVGDLIREDLRPGSKVWLMKSSTIDMFLEGAVTCVYTNPEKLYKVHLIEAKNPSSKLYTPKQLAYRDTPGVVVPVGTRIVARFFDGTTSRIYAGIVAEPPKSTNRHRYLIFFDDGYAQYLEHKDIYVACGQSNDVADDVHENISDFIRVYLQKYPERPMVKLQTNQVTKTEYERKWWDTKVLEVDASMVKMFFVGSNRTEWIYRGSTRLKLLYNELANAEAHRISGKSHRRHNIVPRKPHQPYVEYTREHEHVVTIDSDSEDENRPQPTGSLRAKRKTGGSQYLNNTEKPRNTARKSSTMKPRMPEAVAEVRHQPQDLKSHQGFKDMHNLVRFQRVKLDFKYGLHNCSIICREKENPSIFRGRNPFMIPMCLGWERQLRKFKKGGPRQMVMYRAPCGRHLRDLQEIQSHLLHTRSRLTIDLFSVNTNLMAFRNFRPKEVLFEMEDVTQSRENVPVSCVNSWGQERPPFVEYAAKRFPGKGVPLNEDKEFLCGCSCTDDCQNPEICECQQITNFAYSGNLVGDIGYKFRRLSEPIITGVYECNARCKCSNRCGNRVVQHGLKVRLQMFKTQNKGWGIRCLDDIDAGMFICIYAGQLLTEQGADEDGNQFGDEYLAELDHIEVVEKTKEGYESDIADIENFNLSSKTYDEDADFSNSSDSDVNTCDSDFDFELGAKPSETSAYTTRSRQTKRMRRSDSSSSISTNDDKEASLKNSITGSNPGGESKSVAKKSLTMKHAVAPSPLLPNVKSIKYKSIRAYYGEDGLYIMDAKSKGNIGRYLNHSCSPNVFVQNVFVETHDLRFPEVAFFAQNFIPAGRELTWDYNYEVGSVTNKIMYCYCEARNCRGRLL